MSTFMIRHFILASIVIAGLRAQPLLLPYKPLDVQYSKSLDRLIAISANPNQVHITDPASGAETAVNLSMTPLSLSVAPDGKHAAVGQARSQSQRYV